MREKLIEILRVPIYPHELADPAEVVADYLLDNGVVPVVRCKDCRKRPEGQYGVCQEFNRQTPDDGYCYLGERKEDGK